MELKFKDSLKSLFTRKKLRSDDCIVGIILVVQQDSERLYKLKNLIEMCCPYCKVQGFTNGDEVLELIKRPNYPIDLCFTDVSQEGAGGFELNAALKRKGKRAVVLVTRSGKHALKAWQKNIKGYIIHEHVTLERIAHEIYCTNAHLMCGCEEKLRELAQNIDLNKYCSINPN